MENSSVKYQNYLMVTLLVMLTAMMVAVCQFKVPTIMTDIADLFGMDMNTAAWTMSIFTFVGIFLALPTGSLAQKFGPKNMVIAGVAILVLGSLLGAFTTSPALLITSRGIEGIAFIFVTICGPLTVQKYVEPSKIGSAMGIWAVWVCLGQVLGNNLTPPIFAAVGMKGVWLIYPLVAVVFAILVATVIKTPAGLKAQAANDSKPHYGELFRNKNLWIFVLSFMIFNLVLLAVLSFAPTFMTGIGISVTKAAFIGSIPMLLALISSPVFGKISDVVGGRKKLYLLAMIAMGPAALMMFAANGPVIYIGAILMGLIGLGAPAMMLSSLGEVVGKPELAGIGMGFVMLMQGAGQFLGTFLMPYFLSFTNYNWLFTGFILMVIAFVGALFVALSKFK